MYNVGKSKLLPRVVLTQHYLHSPIVLSNEYTEKQLEKTEQLEFPSIKLDFHNNKKFVNF